MVIAGMNADALTNTDKIENVTAATMVFRLDLAASFIR
jgi:hypothetical protein